LDSNLIVDQVMIDFDTSQNSIIEKGEFINGILRRLEEAKRSGGSSGASKKSLNDFHHVIFLVTDLLSYFNLAEISHINILLFFSENNR
jgi:hypothetical protein